MSFLSVVIPRGRFRFAGFRHELIHLEQDFASRGAFQNHGFDTRDTAFSALRTLSVDTYGASAAVEFARASLGAGILVQHFSLGFEFDRFVHENQDLYGAPDPTQNVFHFSQDGDDISGRRGGRCCGAGIGSKDRRVLQTLAQIRVLVLLERIVGTPQRTPDSTFKVPDTFAVGVSMRVRPGVPGHDRVHARLSLAAFLRVRHRAGEPG